MDKLVLILVRKRMAYEKALLLELIIGFNLDQLSLSLMIVRDITSSSQI
jgi:hypothetical protein